MNFHPIQFVSLGPGDPELLTLKAWKTLQEADLILTPGIRASDGKETSRAVRLIHDAGIDKPVETVVVPMEPRRDAALAIYENIYEKAAQAYREGKRVAVAVEGDAGIYASMHYVLDRCRDAGLPVGQQPGIPSFIAAAGMAQLHLASRQERLTIIPGNITRTEIETYLAEGHTLVVMKLSRCEETVKQCLTAHPEYDWHYFENVGTTNAVHLTHPSDILLRSFPYFSLLILRHAPHRASI